MKHLKQIFSLLLILLLTLGAVLLFNSCDANTPPDPEDTNNTKDENDSNDTNIPDIDPPSPEDWTNAGFEGGFGASVNGTLALNLAVDGEIQMKWENSDEGSLDKIVDWLAEHGYTQYGGVDAKVEVLEGGIIYYAAEKLGSDDKAIVAEVTYITADLSVAEQTLKAGELYFSVTPDSTPVPPVQEAVWPAEQIREVLGAEIPAFAGDASAIIFADLSLGGQKMITVTVYGAEQNADTAYHTLLTQNGYSMQNNGLYRKALANGDELDVDAYMGVALNPNTYVTEAVLTISAMYNKNARQYTAWSALDLSIFNGAELPAYNGGTSFDLEDVGTKIIEQEVSGIQAAIDILAAYESMLDEADKAELAALRAKLPLIRQIKAYSITAYGTTEAEVAAYEEALNAAGFSYGEKDYAEYRLTAEVGMNADENRAVILLTRTPIELFENDEVLPPEASAYTLPANIKLTFTNVYEFTSIKIGDDYYMSSGYMGYSSAIYFKKNGTGWDVYEMEFGTTSWVKAADQATSRESIERQVFDFTVTEADLDSDAVKGGSETVAGRAVDVYTSSWSYGGTAITDTYYKDTETGLILKYTNSYGSLEYTVTGIDTSITSFEGIDLPQ